MSENEILFYPKLGALKNGFGASSTPAQTRLEPGTCKKAEPFALRVLDDSMAPEFKPGCIIVIDPAGRATDGSFVLAHARSDNGQADEGPVFRQLRKNIETGWSLCALNDRYPEETYLKNLDSIIGVIVQRAGARRSYHKHYA